MRCADKVNLAHCIHTKMGKNIIWVKMQEMLNLEDWNKKPQNSTLFPSLKRGKQTGNSITNTKLCILELIMNYSFESMAGNTVLGCARQVFFIVQMGKFKWENN